ncbi:MAG: phage virion morphogenesis protein [Methylococcales bacterium]|nr:phage virion morphogenesis protein [Methylococcales bacterium]
MPVGLDIQVDAGSIQRLQERLRAIQHLPLHSLREDLAAEVVSQTQRRISDEKTDSEGNVWAEWSEDYAAKRHSDHSLLMSEGDLVDDIHFQVEGSQVVVGSGLIYAATHQMGDDSRNIKGRPFLGISTDNENDLIQILDQWADRNI